METTTAIKVEQIMTKDLCKVTQDHTLREVRRVLKQHHIRHAPVVEGDELLGIISLTDVQRLTFGDTFGEDEKSVDTELLESLTAGEVMRKKPVTVSPENTLTEVAEILAEKEFHALPVTDSEGKLAGIVTTTDIIRYLLKK